MWTICNTKTFLFECSCKRAWESSSTVRGTWGLYLNHLHPLGLAVTTVLSLVKTSIWIEEDLSERDRDLRSVMTNKGKGWEQLELFIRVMVIRLTSRTYKLSYRSFTNFESSFPTSEGARQYIVKHFKI